MNFASNFFKWLTLKKATYLIASIGFLTYFNSLFNSYTYDDVDILLGNPLIRSPYYFFTYFTYSSSIPLYDAMIKSLSGSFYRPLNYVLFMLVHPLLGPVPLLYNLLLASFYITSSCLLFLFLKKFFKVGTSFVLTLIFLVHPLNVEVVSHIGSADSLFFLFGILALNILFSEKFGTLNKLLVFCLLLFSIFSKETGLFFLIMACIFTAVFKKKRFKFTLISSVIILSIYSFFRFFVAKPELYRKDYGYILNATLAERFITLPSLIFYYLKTLIFPQELGILQDWVYRSVTINNFFIPLAIVLTTFSLCIYFLFRLKKRNKHLFTLGMIFFFWFVLGMLPHLQIFYPLNTTVAPRWFYFPFVGMVGLFGVVIENYEAPRSYDRGIFSPLLRREQNPSEAENSSHSSTGLRPRFSAKGDKWPIRFRNVFFILFCLTISLLIVRTNLRILNWRNNLALFEHDIKSQKDSYGLIGNLSGEYIDANRLDEAQKILLISVKKNPDGWFNWSNLGVVYQKKKDYEKASACYKKAIENGHLDVAYQNYAIVLLETNKPQEAKNILKEGIIHHPFHFKLWRMLALANKQTGNKKEALEAARRANEFYLDEDGNRLYQGLLKWSNENN